MPMLISGEIEFKTEKNPSNRDGIEHYIMITWSGYSGNLIVLSTKYMQKKLIELQRKSTTILGNSNTYL